MKALNRFGRAAWSYLSDSPKQEALRFAKFITRQEALPTVAKSITINISFLFDHRYNPHVAKRPEVFDSLSG